MKTLPLKYAQKSLLGISLGDAFGDRYFGLEEEIVTAIATRTLTEGVWEFTDDTVMAIALYSSLAQFGVINQDFVATEFTKNYQIDFRRGYGPSMHRKMREIHEGRNWKTVSNEAFSGMGSMGNGGAMRSALIGAYFYEDLDKVVRQARLSSEVTHIHEEGCVGAIAVALATALATKIGLGELTLSPNEFLEAVVQQLPVCDTQSKIKKAMTVPLSYDIRTVVSILGNGVKMIAQDTVPIALWAAAHHLNNFEEALWKAVAALGDRDTICAITAGIVIMSVPSNTVPEIWKTRVEDWSTSKFYKNENNNII